MDEIRIGVLGNVDSGKTTLISLLKYGELDNGRGSARAKVFKHPHEKETGRTSSVSHYYLRSGDNTVSFIDLAGHEKYYKTTIFGVVNFIIKISLTISSFILIYLIGKFEYNLALRKDLIKISYCILPIIFRVLSIIITIRTLKKNLTKK